MFHSQLPVHFAELGTHIYNGVEKKTPNKFCLLFKVKYEEMKMNKSLILASVQALNTNKKKES